MNWVAFQFSEWGWDDYSEVLVVRRSMLEENADLVRRYLAAVMQGLRHVIENPENSAEIAVRYAVDVELTKEQALRRYELQEALVAGSDELPLGHMTADRWNRQVASLIQYGQMELPMCE
ncbi:MAG: ABC transporter substrate-binding protein [Caldilineaceae bacterium SB0675_bin_29]|uniref:ABC transporter substrate-binding protein n=1 Tax=Caldilineaceae bacterium SB0675_bin_29 TaxID=2605266 RepID=A0A6B1G2J6_9CHLR|nr:ABC transporter substrate-binding protein [Caldilineaceae bacterium SB0675_bin_29]